MRVYPSDGHLRVGDIVLFPPRPDKRRGEKDCLLPSEWKANALLRSLTYLIPSSPLVSPRLTKLKKNISCMQHLVYVSREFHRQDINMCHREAIKSASKWKYPDWLFDL